jgi:Flp pilus assembly protein TadD
MRLNRTNEAIAAFRQAHRVDPTTAPSAHANLGLLLARTGHIAEAIAQYQQALHIRPDEPIWLAHLSLLWSMQEKKNMRKPDEAFELAKRACALTQYRDAGSLQALAAAQAAGGWFADAVSTAQRSIRVAALAKEIDLLPMLQEQIRSYQARRLYFSRSPPQAGPYPDLPPIQSLKANDL